MYQYKGHDDTICAIATAPGAGGIALVRLSGPAALKTLAVIFRAKNKKDVAGWLSFTMRYGWIVDPSSNENVDEVLVTLMRAPKSYTCEDVVEISSHGGVVSARTILELCLKHGARLAEPGEFTKRAFLNGRIDLAQAEAVMDVVSARTEVSLRSGAHQLKGDLSRALESAREGLLGVFAGIEALLNFPEEATNAGQAQRLHRDIEGALGKIRELLSTAHAGRVLREGVRIVICGKPNVGKSSLLNALLRHPRAIVTDVAGTTRDVLEETANIGGVPVNLIDTAGILVPRDKVEEEAVRRSYGSIDGADVVLLVLDQGQTLEEADRELVHRVKDARTIVVLNKCDQPCALTPAEISGLLPGKKIVSVSALTRQGMDLLEGAITECALGQVSLSGSGVLLGNIRHIEALERARTYLDRGREALDQGAPFEMVSEDVKGAINQLDAVTGRNIDEDMIERIFARFCIGK